MGVFKSLIIFTAYISFPVGGEYIPISTYFAAYVSPTELITFLDILSGGGVLLVPESLIGSYDNSIL